MFMNEMEIDEAVRRHAQHPVLGRAARILSEFRHAVNACSDGWPYWSPASRAAIGLTNMLQAARSTDWSMGKAPVTPTPADLKRALIPLRSFCTKKAEALKWSPPDLGKTEVTKEEQIATCVDDVETWNRTTLVSYAKDALRHMLTYCSPADREMIYRRCTGGKEV